MRRATEEDKGMKPMASASSGNPYVEHSHLRTEDVASVPEKPRQTALHRNTRRIRSFVITAGFYVFVGQLVDIVLAVYLLERGRLCPSLLLLLLGLLFFASGLVAVMKPIVKRQESFGFLERFLSVYAVLVFAFYVIACGFFWVTSLVPVNNGSARAVNSMEQTVQVNLHSGAVCC